MSNFHTPILLIVFNRVDTTARVLRQIRKVQPRQLFIAADAPRLGNTNDLVQCARVKDLVLASIDWPCTVKTLFLKKNYGPRLAIYKSITWFFKHVEQGIILESDCLPHLTFFSFCEQLLDYYKDNKRVMHIGGNNFQDGVKRGSASYYFSAYPHIWGWATWRRAWTKYDIHMKKYKACMHNRVLSHIFEYSYLAQFFWGAVFSRFYKKEATSTWDYQWTFALWAHQGVAITPHCNLVSNIGFGKGAIHSKDPHSKYANIPTRAIHTLVHPQTFTVDRVADAYTFRNNFLPDIFRFTILFKLRKLLKRI